MLSYSLTIMMWFLQKSDIIWFGAYTVNKFIKACHDYVQSDIKALCP